MSEFTKNGGKWLSAVRSYIQWHFRNGSQVTWGSNDILEPHVTVKQMEEAAAKAVDAAAREVDELKEQIDKLRKELLQEQIKK